MSLRISEHFDIGEALSAFVVLALILPALAMLATRRTVPLPHVVRRPRPETAVLLLYLVVVAWLLVIGFGRIVRVTVEPWHSVAVLGAKLLMFVIIPGAMVWLV